MELGAVSKLLATALSFELNWDQYRQERYFSDVTVDAVHKHIGAVCTCIDAVCDKCN